MGCISGIMKVMNDKSNSHRFPTELNVLNGVSAMLNVGGEDGQNNWME